MGRTLLRHGLYPTSNRNRVNDKSQIQCWSAVYFIGLLAYIHSHRLLTNMNWF